MSYCERLPNRHIYCQAGPHIHRKLKSTYPQVVCRRPLTNCYCNDNLNSVLKFGLRRPEEILAGAERISQYEEEFCDNRHTKPTQKKPFVTGFKVNSSYRKRDFMRTSEPIKHTERPYYENFIGRVPFTNSRSTKVVKRNEIKDLIRAHLKTARVGKTETDLLKQQLSSSEESNSLKKTRAEYPTSTSAGGIQQNNPPNMPTGSSLRAQQVQSAMNNRYPGKSLFDAVGSDARSAAEIPDWDTSPMSKSIGNDPQMTSPLRMSAADIMSKTEVKSVEGMF